MMANRSSHLFAWFGPTLFLCVNNNNKHLSQMKTITSILLSSHKINGNARKNIEALLNGAEKVRTCHTSGSGRFTSNIDSHAATVEGLTKLGLKFKQGNDAAKGGKTGQWVALAEKIATNTSADL